ncbi:sulfite exporter TauE/SafE family protein [Yoonia sediminilitoris]|nr:sulfite exporter TauE/SafE family protein [Yoonia sediminilitoris]
MQAYLNLPLPVAIWFAVVLFGASYVRGFSGFGFTAVLMIGLSTGLPIAEIVPLSIALELAASAAQARGILRNVDWKKLAILAVTGALSTPIGIYSLAFMHDLALRILVLAFILGASCYLVLSRRHPRRFSGWTYALAGASVGIINGATALSGLVLALFLALTDNSPAKIRATMIAYLFLADFWAGGILLAAGFYDSIIFARIAVSLPVLALGVWLGSRHFAAARPETFRHVVLWLLLVLSGLGLLLTVASELG